MKTKFSNTFIGNIRRSAVDFVLWTLGYYDAILPSAIPPEGFEYPRTICPFDCKMPLAMWINHSTFILDVYGIRFLTDPIWSDRPSPFKFVGPKRSHSPPVTMAGLEKLDVIFISHNHYDHTDKRTIIALNKLYPNVLWCVPSGLKRWFNRRGIENVKEFSWWEEHVVCLSTPSASLRIVAVPAQHNSGRTIFDIDKTLWVSYVVEVSCLDEMNKTFYFVGDSGYNPYDFKKIGATFPNIDLSLCPIGAYEPRRFMRTVHANPRDAVDIHLDVGSKKSIGMHWKTFKLSNELENQPPYDLYTEMKRRNLDINQFFPVKPGETVNW